MTIERINLQNTPTVEGVTHEDVSFDSQGVTLNGRIYRPTGAGGALPAVIVTGAWTTVQGQMPGTYARELARRGFAALTFDFRGWGASGGSPRFVEDPAAKTADIRAALGFLADRDDVDTDRISGVGVCASSGYMVDVAATEERMRSVALVAAWLHDPKMAEGIYGGPESAAGLIAAGRDAARKEAETGEATVLEGGSTTNESALMYQAPYYSEPDRGLIESYDNKFNVASWEPWLTYDAQASADTLSKPLLILCSEAAALPAGAHAYAKRTNAPTKEIWLDDVNQFDFYDRMDIVNQSADAVADHFKAN